MLEKNGEALQEYCSLIVESGVRRIASFPPDSIAIGYSVTGVHFLKLDRSKKQLSKRNRERDSRTVFACSMLSADDIIATTAFGTVYTLSGPDKT